MSVSRLAGLGALVMLPVAAHAAAARPVELPAPDLAVNVTPLDLGLTPPLLEPPPPPPPPAPAVEALAAPLPRFVTAVPKPTPAVRDPGGLSCTFVQFRGASGMVDCGIRRLFDGELRGAREVLDEALAKDPRGPQVPAANAWLAEVAFREGRYDEAERRYRIVLGANPAGDLGAHAALGIGWLALRRGDLPEARQALIRAFAVAPPPALGAVLRFVEGVYLLQAGRPAEALPTWEAAASAGPPPQLTEELLIWRSVAQARLGARDQALQGLERFLASAPPRHPLLADAIVQSGWVALARGAPDDAVRRFLWAEREAPRPDLRAQLRAGLVRAYLALGDSGRARDEARRLAADSPRDPVRPMVLLLVADDSIRRGAAAEASDAYRELLTLPLEARLSEYVTYRLAETLEGQGGSAEAQQHYRALRDRGTVEAVAQRAAYRLGLLSLRAGRPGDARSEGETLLRAGVLPELREVALLLAAEAAGRAGDPNRAVSLFRLAVHDYPSSRNIGLSRLALGWALLRDGDPEAALREWREATLAADVDVASHAYLAIADVSLRQGRATEALDALRELGKLAPSHTLTELLALNRGILLVRRKEYAAAVQEMEPLSPRITTPTRQAALRRALGIARYHLGQYDLAERQFRESARWAPAELSSWLGAGLAALAQNRLTEADEALTRARLAASTDVAAPAAYALVLVAARRGDPQAFRERATGFVDRYPAHAYAGLLLYGLVTAALDRGDLDQAGSWIQRLLRAQGQSAYVVDALVRVAGVAARERPRLARQMFTEILARVKEPEARADAWVGLAEAALAVGDGADAQRALESFLSEAPPNEPAMPRALALLVRAHETQGERGRALVAAETFLARFPRHALAPELQLRRGYLLLVEQKWPVAQEALEAARDAGEPMVAAAAHVYLGELYRATGDHEAAVAAYLGAPYLYGDTPWGARGLQGAAQSYLSLNKPREAGIVLRKLTARTGVEPAIQQWARQALATLAPVTGEDPTQALRKGGAPRP